jgi:hypothetical protein
MRRACFWLFAAGVGLGAGGLISQAQEKPPAPKTGAAEVKVEELPSGPERREWEAIRKRHPHAKQGDWVLKRGWGPPAGCMGPFGPQHCFMRRCRENGALSLDWAQVWFSNNEVAEYNEGTGPARLPEEVLQAPRLTPEQAWTRVLQAIQALGAEAPRDYSQPERPVLRHVQDGDRVRLVYQFSPLHTTRRVSVDALNGDVGDVTLSFLGAHFLDPKDPLRVFHPYTWVPTKPPVQ